MKSTLTLFASLCCLAATPAFGSAGHDHGPRFGGIVRDAGTLTFEYVAEVETLTLHVSDHGKPVATKGAMATVMLISGNERQTVALEPAGENSMAAGGSFKVGVGVLAALTFSLPGKSEVKATFNLK